MVSKRWRVFVFLVVILAVAGWWKRDDLSGMLNRNKAPKYQLYSNIAGSYSMPLPDKWKIEEIPSDGKFISRIVVTATVDGFPAGNIGQISMTIVASPSAGQPFSSQEEFNEWRNKAPDEIKGTGILKLANESVDGVESVRLAEVDIIDTNLSQSFWSVTSWFIVKDLNYYVNMMGNGKLTDLESGILTDILGKFKLEKK